MCVELTKSLAMNSSQSITHPVYTSGMYNFFFPTCRNGYFLCCISLVFQLSEGSLGSKFCILSCCQSQDLSHYQSVALVVYSFKLLVKLLSRAKDKSQHMSLETFFQTPINIPCVWSPSQDLSALLSPASLLPSPCVCLTL